MKNFLTMLVLTCLSGFLWSCEYDDTDLWNKVGEIDNRVESLEKKVDKMNGDISSMRTIVDALNKGKVITRVEQLEDGCRMFFSDNTSVEIKNGKDGAAAPVVGVKADTDGRYYWTQTLGGETVWLTDDKGGKIPVSGADGADGTNGVDGITPVIGVDSESYWTVDTGNDPARITDANGNPVKAAPDSSEILFVKVEETATSVTLTQANGTTLVLPKVLPLSIGFAEGASLKVKVGQTKEFDMVTTAGLDYCKVLEITEGWSARLTCSQTRAISGVKMAVTAPAAFTDTNRACEIRILVSDEEGNCKMSKLHLEGVEFELRTLTFEDADAKFAPQTLKYCNVTVSTWSDLIDSPQYGGPMLYGDHSTAEYMWWDEGNTELMHVVPYNYNAYCYWGGGHALSHFNSKNFAKFGDFNNQLTVYNASADDQMNTAGGGHNGSDNFVMHFGYKDGSQWNMTEFLPALTFADGVERVVESMYVNNSTYAINCYIDGNGLTDKIGPDDWVKIVATGYDANGDKTAETSMYMCNGPKNIVREWTKWDLTPLGKVVSIEFNVTGSSDNGYGFSQPAYFAYDDVSVRF